MRISAVFFDIGGVLEANPATGWPERWAGRLAIDLEVFEHLVSSAGQPGTTGGRTLDEIEAVTAARLGIDRGTTTELMEDMWAEYVGTLNGELADYFTSLRPRYRTGMLSNSFVGAREREQQAHGLEDMCDVIVYSHEAGFVKPDAQIYLIACERLDVAPHEAVLLDDVQENIDGAVAVGMNGIGYRDNNQAIAELNALLGD
jgi:epoxide hydrolase-like predicted phosphatase